MPEPDPKGFARAVLWQLAGLRAEMWALKNRFIAKNGLITEEAQDLWEQEVRDQHRYLYNEGLKQAALDDPDFEPPPEEPPPSRV